MIKQEIHDLDSLLTNSWNSFKEFVPGMLLAAAVAVIGLFIIGQIKSRIFRLLNAKSKDQLVSDFLVNVFAVILSIILISLCLSIVGWGNVTNKILAGAGITTFIVGFALKDIGENFLAGILMAFKRPFRLGDLIEVEKVKGKVVNMSLRVTTVKTLDGKEVYVPNGYILRNPLQNYTIDDLHRNEFNVLVPFTDAIDTILSEIEQKINETNGVLPTPASQVAVDNFADGKYSINIKYWFNTNNSNISGAKLRSNLMVTTVKTLVDRGLIKDINVNNDETN